jgi:sulfatase modifying factor 1
MMRRFRVLLIALGLLAGIFPLAAQTNVFSLGIAPMGRQNVLFWPAVITNYVLQTATNPASTNWVAVSNAVPFTAVAVTNTGKAAFYRIFIKPPNPTGMTLIPGGTFTMGDTLDADTFVGSFDADPVQVTVSSFYMDLYLVASNQWRAVYNYGAAHGYGFANFGSGRDTNHPAQTLDWFDAVKWSNARSQQGGLTPCYYTDAALTKVYTNGESNPFVNWSANGYRLPTEAEWEVAARGGLANQRFPWGNTIDHSQANYYGFPVDLPYDNGASGNDPATSFGPPPYTTAGGYYPANGYGLFDMAGNLSEWCWDWYGTTINAAAYAGGTNPHGAGAGTLRVLRGGNYNVSARSARCAARGYDDPTAASGIIGFRCVRGL